MQMIDYQWGAPQSAFTTQWGQAQPFNPFQQHQYQMPRYTPHYQMPQQQAQNPMQIGYEQAQPMQPQPMIPQHLARLVRGY